MARAVHVCAYVSVKSLSIIIIIIKSVKPIRNRTNCKTVCITLLPSTESPTLKTIRLDCLLSLFRQSNGRANQENKLGETRVSERAVGNSPAPTTRSHYFRSLSWSLIAYLLACSTVQRGTASTLLNGWDDQHSVYINYVIFALFICLFRMVASQTEAVFCLWTPRDWARYSPLFSPQ